MGRYIDYDAVTLDLAEQLDETIYTQRNQLEICSKQKV